MYIYCFTHHIYNTANQSVHRTTCTEEMRAILLLYKSLKHKTSYIRLIYTTSHETSYISFKTILNFGFSWNTWTGNKKSIPLGGASASVDPWHVAKWWSHRSSRRALKRWQKNMWTSLNALFVFLFIYLCFQYVLNHSFVSTPCSSQNHSHIVTFGRFLDISYTLGCLLMLQYSGSSSITGMTCIRL